VCFPVKKKQKDTQQCISAVEAAAKGTKLTLGAFTVLVKWVLEVFSVFLFGTGM